MQNYIQIVQDLSKWLGWYIYIYIQENEREDLKRNPRIEEQEQEENLIRVLCFH